MSSAIEVEYETYFLIHITENTVRALRLHLSIHWFLILGINITRYGFGPRIRLVVIRGFSLTPGGAVTRYFCIREVKNNFNSMVARLSPRHFLLPVIKLHVTKKGVWSCVSMPVNRKWLQNGGIGVLVQTGFMSVL